jgi:hypothetical protein
MTPDIRVGPALHSANVRRVRPSTPEDGPAIVALMREVGLEPHSDPEHLHWKYWQKREDWSGPRSFVLASGTDLLAHVALVPGTCISQAGRVRIGHMIDWAARRSEIGAGAGLMKHVAQSVDLLLGIGGSSQALQLMPRIGYKHVGDVTGYARVLSPRAFLERPCHPAWKRGPRLIRGMLWSATAPRADLGEWQPRQIAKGEIEKVLTALPTRRAHLAVLERSAAKFCHVLACPVLPIELYIMEKRGSVGGYFVMSYAPGQARLADCWMASEDAADWRSMLEAAVRAAARHGEMAELVVWASYPQFAGLLRQSGFHARLTLPIHIRSSGALPVPDETIRVQMLDNDAFYLYFEADELWA